MFNLRTAGALAIIFLIGSGECSAQQVFFKQELLNLADPSRLPAYRTGEMEQISSYDRTGGNDDGFSGKYSFIRKDPEGLVIADLRGPGVVNRIWTPTPTSDTIKFYFDGEKNPRVAVPFLSLFTGKEPPFLSPLSGSELGGYYSYLPIPYEKSLRIVYTGKNLRFHQIQYRTLAKGEKVKSFSMDMIDSQKEVLAQIAQVWQKGRSPMAVYGAKLRSEKVSFVLKPGTEAKLFSMTKGGRIAGLEIGAGSDLIQAYRKVTITARWDKEANFALDLPLHDFFGFAFGVPSMQSLLLGSDQRKLYCYLPMPFDASAEISLKYDQPDAPNADGILISATVYFTEEKRDPDREGKLYAQSRREYNIPSGASHVIADVKGRGHYVGTVLQTQGLEEGHTGFFEGDDRAFIDGKMKFHGTGSEDYFNGGYYAVTDKWDRRMSLPIHGALAYDMMTSRTGGYRFYLTDKIGFDQSFRLTIEHQPVEKNNVKTDYTSTGFFYADKPVYDNTPLRINPTTAAVEYRDKLTPQGMVISLYWLASAEYQDPSILFTLKRSDSWTANVDPEAMPIAQVYLNGLDNGRYKLYVEYGQTDLKSPFSIWQRSVRVSDWLSVDGLMAADGRKTVYGGEIEITDELKTITIRKKLNDSTSARIYSFQFEKIGPRK